MHGHDLHEDELVWAHLWQMGTSQDRGVYMALANRNAVSLPADPEMLRAMGRRLIHIGDALDAALRQ